MNKMVWLIPLIAANVCFAGGKISRESSGRKEPPPSPLKRSSSSGRHCTQCDARTSEYINFCENDGCQAIMCRECEVSECTNKQLLKREEKQPRKLRKPSTRKLFFVYATCKLCQETSRLYENEGTSEARAKISERSKTEEAAFVYQ